MKLIVFSDSHRRNITDMLAIIEEEKPDAVLHLGDVAEDADDIRAVFPQLQLFQVCGNNDWTSEIPENLVVRAEQARIFITHGHLHGVRRHTRTLAAAAKKSGCGAALYGHTHRAEIHEEDGILIANPGSISMPYVAEPPSYLRLTVTGATIQPELVYLAETQRKSRRGWRR